MVTGKKKGWHVNQVTYNVASTYILELTETWSEENIEYKKWHRGGKK